MPIRGGAVHAGRSALEVNLAADPEQIALLVEAVGRELHGVAINRVLPVEVNFRVGIQVPVHARINCGHFVGPKRRVGQAIAEDLIPNGEVAEPRLDLERTRTSLSVP